MMLAFFVFFEEKNNFIIFKPDFLQFRLGGAVGPFHSMCNVQFLNYIVVQFSGENGEKW